MKIEKKILLPLDGSDASLAAVLPAKSIAVLLDMTINIVYISESIMPVKELLSKLKIQAGDLPRFIISQKCGNPADIILSESQSASFIVISTHGETYDLTKTIGSVASKVIEESKIPVLLIRPDAKLLIKDTLWKPSKILIPLNGAPGSAHALIPAFELLSKTSMEVDLLHISVSGKGRPEEPGSMTAPYYTDFPQYEWPQWTREFYKRFCHILVPKGVKFKLSLASGNPACEIISYAKVNDVDLIAIAWHGNIGDLHAGVLKEIIQRMPCPVLLTRILKHHDDIR